MVLLGLQYGTNFNRSDGGLSAPYGNSYGVHLVSQLLCHTCHSDM